MTSICQAADFMGIGAYYLLPAYLCTLGFILHRIRSAVGFLSC